MIDSSQVFCCLGGQGKSSEQKQARFRFGGELDRKSLLLKQSESSCEFKSMEMTCLFRISCQLAGRSGWGAREMETMNYGMVFRI